MLPKPYRLRHDKDLKTLFQKGKSVFDVVVGAKYQVTKNDVSRFAVVVGTKVSKSAVKRNRMRRQIRAMIEGRLTEMKPGFDIAILVRPEAIGLKRDELEQHVLGTLSKIGVL